MLAFSVMRACFRMVEISRPIPPEDASVTGVAAMTASFFSVFRPEADPPWADFFVFVKSPILLFCFSRLLNCFPFRLLGCRLLHATSDDGHGRIRSFDDEVRIAQDGDGIQIADRDDCHVTDIAETLVRRNGGIRKCDEGSILAFRRELLEAGNFREHRERFLRLRGLRLRQAERIDEEYLTVLELA